MMDVADRPLFSIIIPTRNRAALFAVAFRSVLEQRFEKFELIVVNDGSSAEQEVLYREIINTAPGQVRMLSLLAVERGHGQGYALNFGAAEARGDYLCFLDDDDQWIDPENLGRAANVVAASTGPPDLILAHQQAFRDGTAVSATIWIEDLESRLNRTPDSTGAYTVTPAELLTCPAHCHVNTTIIAKSLFAEIGGLDEGIRYETDRDFYLRAIDRARIIKYLPFLVSRHNIPDPTAKANMSTVDPELAKRLSQLRVLDKAVLFSLRRELRRYAMRERAYTLKHIATEAARLGQSEASAYYARQALMAGFSFGWLGMAAFLTARRLVPDRIAHRFSPEAR
jgi:glycosyltransferase involved in cell wall biosynthesis